MHLVIQMRESFALEFVLKFTETSIANTCFEGMFFRAVQSLIEDIIGLAARGVRLNQLPNEAFLGYWRVSGNLHLGETLLIVWTFIFLVRSRQLIAVCSNLSR